MLGVVTHLTSSWVSDVLRFYPLPAKSVEAEIWRLSKARRDEAKSQDTDSVPEDERVEDAGLAEAA